MPFASRNHLTSGSVSRMAAKAPRSVLPLILRAGIAALWLSLGTVPVQADRDPVSVPARSIAAGRVIYDLGILPDGSPLRGAQATGAVLVGSPAACASCHRRSGYGASEGSILVPPISWGVLSSPGPHFVTPGATPTGATASMSWNRALTRSPYAASSLARALREGLDPDGDALMPPMPRYELSEEAFASLLAFLQRLSAVSSPGISPEALHLATVVTPDAPPGAEPAVLGVLRAWAAGQPTEFPWRLQEWRLHGSPETWEAQLDERYRQQPVFALLSGVGGAQWSPIHRFCEREGVACVLPSLEVLPEQAGRETDSYSLYFSPGLDLESELLARHFQSLAAEDGHQTRIVQIYADASGKHAAESLGRLANGFASEVRERRLRPIAPGGALAGVSGADILVLWLRPPELASIVAQAPQGPPAERVFLSAMLAPAKELSLPPAWRARVIYVSLFDDWSPQSAYSRTWLAGWLDRAGLPRMGDLRLQADAYGACYFFTRAFAEMQKGRLLWRGENLTRPYLLERLESTVAKNTGDPLNLNAWAPFYWRLSLAPGQRIAARGGHLLRYVSPESETLVPLDAREFQRGD